MLKQVNLYDRFEVLDNKGEGGYAVVYVVKDKTDNNVYALKQFDFVFDDPNNEKSYRDFLHEVELLQSLTHANLGKVVEALIVNKKPAILQELIEGETLEDITKRELLSLEDIEQLVLQVSSALYYCHRRFIHSQSIGLVSDSQLVAQKAVIHNDIHPKNVMRRYGNAGEKGSFVLIDFGLSVNNPEAIRHSHMRNGMPEYKAPEKWKQEAITVKTDIYSFGVLLFRAATNREPFMLTNPDDPAQLVKLEQDHLKSLVPDVRACRREAAQKFGLPHAGEEVLPDWLVYMIERCLKKEPAERFKDGQDLNDFFHKRQSFSTQPKPEPPPDTPAREEPAIGVVTPRGGLEENIILVAGPSLGDRFKDFLSQKKTPIRWLVGIILAALMVIWLYPLLKSTDPLNPEASDVKQILMAYFKADEAAFTREQVNALGDYFVYPCTYYSRKMQRKEDFTAFYTSALARVAKKELRIDSIVPALPGDSIHFRVYGILKRYRSDNVIKQKDIKDIVEIEQGKIRSIVRVERGRGLD